MAKSEYKSLSAGVGVSILTAIAGIFSSYLRAHPAYLIGGGIAGVVLLLWPLFQWLFGEKKVAEEKPASSSAGGDNNGAQIGGSVLGDSALEKILNAGRDKAFPVAPTVPSNIVPLQFHWHFRYARLIFSNGVWREADGNIGFQAVLADISVVPPSKGMRSRNCDVYGAIELRGADSKRLAFLNRAYWAREAGNEMSFEIGTSATLVVLSFEAHSEWQKFEWVLYQNPLKRLPDHPFFDSSKQELGKRVAIPVDGQPTAKVSLVDAHSSEVLDSKTVQLKVANSVWMPEEVPDEI